MTRLVPSGAQISKRVLRLALWVLPFFALANTALLLIALDGSALGVVVSHPKLLIWAAVLTFIPWMTNAARLALWGRFLSLHLSPGKIIRVIAGTVVANAVTPSTTGGPALKWALLVGEGVPASKASTLMSFQVAEDSSTLLPLVALALVAVGSSIELDILTRSGLEAVDLLVILAILGVATASLYAAARHGVLGRRVCEWTARVTVKLCLHWKALVNDWRMMLETGKSVALATTTLAAIQWIARFSIATLVIGAAGGAMQPALHWLLQWMVQSLGSVVPTPGGAGGVEAAFLTLFAPFLDSAALVPVMTIWRLLFFYLPLTVAALMLVFLQPGKDEKAPQVS